MFPGEQVDKAIAPVPAAESLCKIEPVPSAGEAQVALHAKPRLKACNASDGLLPVGRHDKLPARRPEER